MKRFGRRKNEEIIEAEIVVPEEEKEETSELERKFEEKGKNIGRKAGKILHESKQKAEQFKGKIKEKDYPGKVKKTSSDIRTKVKEKVSKK